MSTWLNLQCTLAKNILCIVPSFPVCKATLQKVNCSMTMVMGVFMLVFDGFARKCNLLEHPLPAMAKIQL